VSREAQPGPAEEDGDDPRRPIQRYLEHNIRELVEVRREFERRKSTQDRIADAITAFAGSMRFVWLHAALFGGWIVWNSGLVPGARPFDPFPYVMLAMIASVEAIFLSTFVLISQNRSNELADKRADADLQISLLAEHEITHVLRILRAVAGRIGVDLEEESETFEEELAPQEVVGEIERVSAEDGRDGSDGR
jgi:uncharacterized membrane protein